MSAPKLTHPWKLLPLYGLKISDDDGLTEPLFGDATLVSHEAAIDLLGEVSGVDYAKAVISPMMSQLYSDSANQAVNDLPPRQYLVEAAPDSYIAVRRDSDDDADERAGEVRALLTATLMLRSGVLGAFSDRSTNLAWSIEPKSVGQNKKGKVHALKKVRLNEHVTRVPLQATKAEIRSSWLSGTNLPAGPKVHLSWDINRIYPICRLLGSHSISSKWAKRLRSIARHLNDACCAETNEQQLVMAITCLEGIFCTGGMHDQKLLPRIEAFDLKFTDGKMTVKTLLDARNKYVHEGESLKEEGKLAKAALGIGWAFLDTAAWFVTSRPRQEEWEAYLDMMRQHRAVMKIVAKEFSEADAAAMGDQMKAMLHKAIPGRRTTARGGDV